MSIHPSLPACATPRTKVFAHTQVRDPRESAAAQLWTCLGEPIPLALGFKFVLLDLRSGLSKNLLFFVFQGES